MYRKRGYEMKQKLFTRKQLGIPYGIFLALFVVLPLFIVVYYAFTNGEGQISFDNFQKFFRNSRAIGTLVYSLAIAVCTTASCLALAYPLAYIFARNPWFRRHGSKRQVLLMLFILPMWINFTLRITAIKEILSFIEGNMAFYPFLNSIICMTYDFLPFMIMPIYNSLEKIDASYPEAARDLGAGKLQVILKVMIPLSMPGIVSGITMVFLPAMTNYVVLDMVYNSTYIMGSLIGSYFNSYDWHNGSVISLLLLGIIVLGSILSDMGQGKERSAA